MSIDKNEEDVKKYIATEKIPYPNIMATKEILESYQKAMKKPIRGVPTTVVVNRKGEIITVHEGFRPKKVFEDEIQKLLKEKKEKEAKKG